MNAEGAKPGVGSRGGKIAHSAGAWPLDRVATPGGSAANPSARDRGETAPSCRAGATRRVPASGEQCEPSQAMGRVGAGRSYLFTRSPLAWSCGTAEGVAEAGPGAGTCPGAGALGALTNCSAQRQMSEQRPVQQPMVPAASERR